MFHYAVAFLFLTHLDATLFIRSPFPLRTPVERSERVAGCWSARARANPLSLWVWHFTLRFVLPGVGLATRAEGRKAVACSHPLDPKSTQSMLVLNFRRGRGSLLWSWMAAALPPAPPHLLTSHTQAYGGLLSVGGGEDETGEESAQACDAPMYHHYSGAVCEEGREGCAQQSIGARHDQKDESAVRATWWTGTPQNAEQSDAGGGRVGEGRQARRGSFDPRSPGILSTSTWKLKSPLPRLRALVFRTLGMLPSASRHSSRAPRGSFTTPPQPLPADACRQGYGATTHPPSRLSGGPSPCVRPFALSYGHGSLAPRVSEPPPYPPPSAPAFTTRQVPLEHAPAEETAVHVRSRQGLSVSARAPAHCGSPAFCKVYCDCTLQQDSVVSWRGYRPSHCT